MQIQVSDEKTGNEDEHWCQKQHRVLDMYILGTALEEKNQLGFRRWDISLCIKTKRCLNTVIENSCFDAFICCGTAIQHLWTQDHALLKCNEWFTWIWVKVRIRIPKDHHCVGRRNSLCRGNHACWCSLSANEISIVWTRKVLSAGCGSPIRNHCSMLQPRCSAKVKHV